MGPSLLRTKKNSRISLSTDSPARPSRPKVLALTSNSVTISWEESPCDGGHTISDFNIRYAEPFSYYYYFRPPPIDFFGDYTYIRGIDGNTRNHTITRLQPSTTYEISVQAASVDATFSPYSLQRTVTTLSPGEFDFHMGNGCVSL